MSAATLAHAPLRLRVLPGVWRPHSDARMLARYVFEHGLAEGRDVLDVFTGSGALALAAARGGARSVTAIDLSRRSLVAVRFNAWRNRVHLRTVRGDVFAPVAGERFDLILANPPYFPGAARLPDHSAARAWEGGYDGRVLVDRLCTSAARHLRQGGQLLIVHNTMTGESETRRRLESDGLHTEVVLRHRGPLGPVGRAAAALLRERETPPASADSDEEEIVVIAGTQQS
ncbi:MAG: methyltransferase [Solirubrobacterales bacterium]|nr:methyltransferase [Solirubrobacterales bacterium]